MEDSQRVGSGAGRAWWGEAALEGQRGDNSVEEMEGQEPGCAYIQQVATESLRSPILPVPPADYSFPSTARAALPRRLLLDPACAPNPREGLVIRETSKGLSLQCILSGNTNLSRQRRQLLESKQMTFSRVGPLQVPRQRGFEVYSDSACLSVLTFKGHTGAVWNPGKILSRSKGRGLQDGIPHAGKAVQVG